MPDRMGEKVARAMFRQDHDEGWGAGETATKLIYLNNADAALDACHFEELVAELKMYIQVVQDLDEEFPHAYSSRLRKARALLAKVEASDA